MLGPGSSVLHYLAEFAQIHVHCVDDAIQLSHPLSSPSPPAFNHSQHQGLFQWVGSSHQVAKVFHLQLQSFQWIFRTDFLLDGLVGSLCSSRDSQESSLTPQFKSISSSVLSFLYGTTLTSIFYYWKNVALTRQTFVGNIMSLLFNMLSSLVITFISRSKHLLISWLQSPSTVISVPPKIKSVTVSTVYPSNCLEVMGPDAMMVVFWMLSFKPTFHSSFPFIKRLFSSSSLSAISTVSSAYLRLLIFLPAILIQACASSSAAFLMYSAKKLNKQGDSIQPWHIYFPIWN